MRFSYSAALVLIAVLGCSSASFDVGPGADGADGAVVPGEEAGGAEEGGPGPDDDGGGATEGGGGGDDGGAPCVDPGPLPVACASFSDTDYNHQISLPRHNALPPRLSNRIEHRLTLLMPRSGRIEKIILRLRPSGVTLPLNGAVKVAVHRRDCARTLLGESTEAQIYQDDYAFYFRQANVMEGLPAGTPLEVVITSSELVGTFEILGAPVPSPNPYQLEWSFRDRTDVEWRPPSATMLPSVEVWTRACTE